MYTRIVVSFDYESRDIVCSLDCMFIASVTHRHQTKGQRSISQLLVHAVEDLPNLHVILCGEALLTTANDPIERRVWLDMVSVYIGKHLCCHGEQS